MERIEWFEEDFNPKAFFLSNLFPMVLFLIILTMAILGIFLLITYLRIPVISWIGFILSCSGAVILILALTLVVLALAFGKKGIFQYGLSDDGITIAQKFPDPVHDWPIKIGYNEIESTEIVPFKEISRIVKSSFQGRYFESFFSIRFLDTFLSGGRTDFLIIHLKEGKLIYYKKGFVLGDTNKIRFSVAIKPKDMEIFVSKIKARQDA